MRFLLPCCLALLLLTACGEAEDPPRTPSGEPRATPTEPAAAERPEAPTRPPEVTQVWRGEGDVIKVSVWELHCGGCEMSVENALGEIAGVEEVKADRMTATVTLRVSDPSRREDLIARIRDALHENERQIIGEDEIVLEEGDG
ncbi:MAG: heavy-metal-associated domain-containing protein [Planctomycetota bacterium]|jgi:copper chaperone CopZ